MIIAALLGEALEMKKEKSNDEEYSQEWSFKYNIYIDAGGGNLHGVLENTLVFLKTKSTHIGGLGMSSLTGTGWGLMNGQREMIIVPSPKQPAKTKPNCDNGF